MNKKNNQHKENADEFLDSKLIIGERENERKVCNIILYTVLFLNALIFIGLLVSKQREAIIFFLMLGIILPTLNYANKKIIIENSKISKVSLFSRKKEIGSMSEITSISKQRFYVTVFKNNEKIFSFNIYASEDTKQLYNYLKSRYNHSIRINGTEILCMIYRDCSIILVSTIYDMYDINKGYITLGDLPYAIMAFIMLLIFIIWEIDEHIKKFQIIEDKIIYKRVFFNKRYNISDLTKIEYKQRKFYSRRGRYVYTSVGYINKKKVFKVYGFTPETISLLREIIKKYNPECKIKKIYNKLEIK